MQQSTQHPTITCEICHGHIGVSPPPPPEEYGCRCPECPVCGARGNPQCFQEQHLGRAMQPVPYGQTFYDYFRKGKERSGAILPKWDKLLPEERDLIQASVEVAIQHYRTTCLDGEG